MAMINMALNVVKKRRVPLHLALADDAYSSLYPDFLPPSPSDIFDQNDLEILVLRERSDQ